MEEIFHSKWKKRPFHMNDVLSLGCAFMVVTVSLIKSQRF